MTRIRDREKQRGYERAWYARNREKAREKVKTRKAAVVAWFRSFKATLQCSRCDESDPVCLDFHHREPLKKSFSLNEVWYYGWGVARILAEVAKCDVLCANCHRKLHRDEREKELEAILEWVSDPSDPPALFDNESLE